MLENALHYRYEVDSYFTKSALKFTLH